MNLFANIYFILDKRRIIYPKTIKLQFTENRIPHFYFQRLHPLCNIYAFNIYHSYCNIYCNISKLNLPRKRRNPAVFEMFAPRFPKPRAVSSSLTTPAKTGKMFVRASFFVFVGVNIFDELTARGA